MHYLITGHTGFKGAWLAHILKTLGHEVSGYSQKAIPNSLYDVTNLQRKLNSEKIADIRDLDTFRTYINQIRPGVIIHLAAQPLVQFSYLHPRETFETNVMGTLNLLEISSTMDCIESQVIITTDKVYRNVGQIWGYRENDPLGGNDPYSASKAMADLLIQCWVKSFSSLPPTAIARAGNVLGGGDISKNRLLPDLISTWKNDETFEMRMPESVRPWQHVLDCLNGYLILEEAVRKNGISGEWNFGPGVEGFKSVKWIVKEFQSILGHQLRLKEPQGQKGGEEAALLSLDSTKSEIELGWQNKISVSDSIKLAIEWELESQKIGASQATQNQIDKFFSS